MASTSSSLGSRPWASCQRRRTASIRVIFWMWTRLWAPIGSRASAMLIGTPWRSNTLANTTAGAMQPKSIVVPAQSSSTARTGPR
jgi:hypothetical protein